MLAYIPIVLCFDEKYAPYAAVTIYSTFIKTKKNVKFYCLVPESDVKNIASIEKLKRKFSIDIKIIPYGEVAFSKWRVSGQFSLATYAKLIIPSFVNEDKIIYLDSDTLILKDITELYDTYLDKYSIAGIKDNYGGEFSLIPRQKDDIYINAGVLLMNLKQLRKENFLEKCSEIYEKYIEKLKMFDQCIINKYAEGKKLILDPKWNVQIAANVLPKDEWLQKSQNASIAHFIFLIKPWMKWCNPDVYDFYWKYASNLEFCDVRPIELSTFGELVQLANIVDAYGNFEKSSQLKTQMINILIQKLNN